MPATIAAVARLLVAFPATDGGGGTATEMRSEARGEAFVMALDDLPAWAVAAACRDWLRGDGGKGGENYAFAPSPPQLRRLAERHAMVARGRAVTLDLLAGALAEREFTDDHRRQMLGRLAALRQASDSAA